MTTVCNKCQTPVVPQHDGKLACDGPHKCETPIITVEINCSCGWKSAGWCNKGARKNAYAEWREHKRVSLSCKNFADQQRKLREEAEFAAEIGAES